MMFNATSTIRPSVERRSLCSSSHLERRELMDRIRMEEASISRRGSLFSSVAVLSGGGVKDGTRDSPNVKKYAEKVQLICKIKTQIWGEFHFTL